MTKEPLPQKNSFSPSSPRNVPAMQTHKSRSNLRNLPKPATPWSASIPEGPAGPAGLAIQKLHVGLVSGDKGGESRNGRQQGNPGSRSRVLKCNGAWSLTNSVRGDWMWRLGALSGCRDVQGGSYEGVIVCKKGVIVIENLEKMTIP